MRARGTLSIPVGATWLGSANRIFAFASLLGLAASALSGCGKPKAGRDGNASFLLDSGAPVTTETAVTSSRPLDNGKSFRLGYGYDNLSGERRVSCLDPTKYDLMGRNVRTTVTNFEIVNNKEELANQLNIQVNAEASGSYGSVTGSASTKTQIMKSAHFGNNTMMGLLSFVHRAQEIGIEDKDMDLLTEANITLLNKDNGAFRLHCGDVFTRSVTTGAALYVVVNVTSKTSEITNHTETENSIKAAFMNLYSASATTAVTAETKKTLANYHIAIKCSTVGTSADACAQAIDSANSENLSSVIDFLNNAKKAVATSVSSSPDMMVAVDEIFADYPKPGLLATKKKKDVFFDYSPQKAVVNDLLAKELVVDKICDTSSISACSEAQLTLAQQIKDCARQENWPDCDPTQVKLDKILDDSRRLAIGKVFLYQNGSGSSNHGQTMSIDFDKLVNGQSVFFPGKIYNLTDYGYNDVPSSFASTLAPGWQMRVFEAVDAGGRCYMIGTASPRIIDFGWFGHKASSFRLERVGDYPTTCN